MVTTYFRPSIHGWPFHNSWKKSIVFDRWKIKMGFCGGMCWRAAQRYFNGIQIAGDINKPREGDSLYTELWETQKKSTSSSKIWQIFEWQKSPDLSHSLNPRHSLGYRTQKEWPKIKKSIDKGHPVTITLIAHSNDYNPFHLKDHHRTIVYAYDIEKVESENSFVPKGAKKQVTLMIYDPNFPKNDEIALTFYLGADRSNIRLRHSEKEEYHGFFWDDKNRSHKYSTTTSLTIRKCQLVKINSKKTALYDFDFSWTSKVIPFFKIFINGEPWKDNEKLKEDLLPRDLYEKQCNSRIGSKKIRLIMPRSISNLKVQLFGYESYVKDIEIDANPSFKCYPFVRTRASGEAVCISDKNIKESDLFIKTENPSSTAIKNLDTSEFRWVLESNRTYTENRKSGNNRSTAHLSTFEKRRIGNVKVPVFANFIDKNMAKPIRAKGELRIYRGNFLVNRSRHNNLKSVRHKIFSGFKNNPSDFDSNSRVEFLYEAIDKFGMRIQGKTKFYSRSIIYKKSSVSIDIFDPAKLAKLELVARELVELGLIDIVLDPPRNWNGPRPNTQNPVTLLNRLRKQPSLQHVINIEFKKVWGSQKTWKDVWKAQSEALPYMNFENPIPVKEPNSKGIRNIATIEFNEQLQNQIDAIPLQLLSNKVIKKLINNSQLKAKLMTL